MASCEKDHLPQNPSKLINGVSMDRFSQVCDNFIDFQVPNQTLEEVSSVLKNGANIALVTNHQSYFEIEAIRYFCQRLNQVSEKPIPSVLFYSAPAVESNTKFLLETRLPIYRQHGLILLPIIRQVDKTNKYQECITPEMRSQTRKSLQLYADTIKQGGCLLIHPFELTLQGGRLNLMTGEINGIQPNKEASLVSLIKSGFYFLPCGVDGSYKVINPDNNQPSCDFIKALNNIPSSNQPVSFRTGQLIDCNSPTMSNLDVDQKAHQIVIEVAKLVSSEARGAYRQKCLELLK